VMQKAEKNKTNRIIKPKKLKKDGSSGILPQHREGDRYWGGLPGYTVAKGFFGENGQKEKLWEGGGKSTGAS